MNNIPWTRAKVHILMWFGHDYAMIPWFVSILSRYLNHESFYSTFLTFKISFGISLMVERWRYRTPLNIFTLWFFITNNSSIVVNTNKYWQINHFVTRFDKVVTYQGIAVDIYTCPKIRVHVFLAIWMIWSRVWPSWPISVFENWFLVLIGIVHLV